MKPWPRAHKSLGIVVLLALGAATACYFLLIRPKAQEVTDLTTALEDLRSKLKDSGWPANAEGLKVILNENSKKLKGTKKGNKDGKGYEGLEVRAAQIIAKATDTFRQHIEDNYTTVGTFIDQAGWLDYTSDFSNLEQWLRGNGIIISEKTFGISEDTADAETYQLLIHIWTVRKLVELIIEHDLILEKDRRNPVPTPEGRAVLPSMIRVMPMKAYVLNEGEKTPYLLEFPVRMTLRGSLPDFIAFMRDLQTEGRFFPISRMELFTENPALRGTKPNSDGFLRVRNIKVTVVCSSFFRPAENVPKATIKRVNKVPRGA